MLYLVYDSRPLRNLQQPSALSAGLFWYAADASSLVDDVYQNGPNDRQVVGCCKVARTPAGGPEMPHAQRRGISSSSAPQWLTGIRQPLFCRTVVAPECTKGFGYPFAGGQHGSIRKCLYLN